jgi:hypothetical protein
MFQIWVIIHDDEIEEGLQLGVAVPLGGFGLILRDQIQEMEEILASNGL